MSRRRDLTKTAAARSEHRNTVDPDRFFFSLVEFFVGERLKVRAG
jgi:hypothetical protein